MLKNGIVFPVLLLILVMVSIQSGAAIAKEWFSIVGVVEAAFLRISIASLILMAIFRPWKGKLKKSEYTAIFFYGSSLGGMNLLFYLALQRIPLGINVALEFLGPLTVALISSRHALDFLWAFLAIAGVTIISLQKFSPSALDPLGVVFALSAGGCWALYILFGKKAGTTIPGGKLVALGMFVAALVIFPLFLFFRENTPIFQFQVLKFAFIVAILSSAFPYTLEIFAIKALPLKIFGILMSLEPAIAAFSGMIFLKEELALFQWLAIACIISASIGCSLSIRPNSKKPTFFGT